MRKLEVPNTNVLHSILKDTCARTSSSLLLHRMHCVLLVGKGRSCYQVGEWFGEDPRTIERWVHHYNKCGIEGLKDDRKGRPAKVCNEQRKKLQQDIKINPDRLGYNQNGWDGKLLQTHLARRYGVQLSVRQCQRLLHQL